MGRVGAVYGTPSAIEATYEEISRAAPDLVGRLRALNQLGHVTTTDPAIIEAVRAALFQAAGYGRHG